MLTLCQFVGNIARGEREGSCGASVFRAAKEADRAREKNLRFGAKRAPCRLCWPAWSWLKLSLNLPLRPFTPSPSLSSLDQSQHREAKQVSLKRKKKSTLVIDLSLLSFWSCNSTSEFNTINLFPHRPDYVCLTQTLDRQPSPDPDSQLQNVRSLKLP